MTDSVQSHWQRRLMEETDRVLSELSVLMIRSGMERKDIAAQRSSVIAAMTVAMAPKPEPKKGMFS